MNLANESNDAAKPESFLNLFIKGFKGNRIVHDKIVSFTSRVPVKSQKSGTTVLLLTWMIALMWIGGLLTLWQLAAPKAQDPSILSMDFYTEFCLPTRFLQKWVSSKIQVAFPELTRSKIWSIFFGNVKKLDLFGKF